MRGRARSSLSQLELRTCAGKTHNKAVREPNVDRVHRVLEQRKMGRQLACKHRRIHLGVDKLNRAPFAAADEVDSLHGEQQKRVAQQHPVTHRPLGRRVRQQAVKALDEQHEVDAWAGTAHQRALAVIGGGAHRTPRRQ